MSENTPTEPGRILPEGWYRPILITRAQAHALSEASGHGYRYEETLSDPQGNDDEIIKVWVPQPAIPAEIGAVPENEQFWNHGQRVQKTHVAPGALLSRITRAIRDRQATGDTDAETLAYAALRAATEHGDEQFQKWSYRTGQTIPVSGHNRYVTTEEHEEGWAIQRRIHAEIVTEWVTQPFSTPIMPILDPETSKDPGESMIAYLKNQITKVQARMREVPDDVAVQSVGADIITDYSARIQRIEAGQALLDERSKA